MKQWTRWQDWVALAAGAYALLAPIWTPTTNTATWTMVVLGVVTALAALWSLYRPRDVYSEGAHAEKLWVDAPGAMAITAWVVGAVTLVVGLLALPESNRLHHQPLGSH